MAQGIVHVFVNATTVGYPLNSTQFNNSISASVRGTYHAHECFVRNFQ